MTISGSMSLLIWSLLAKDLEGGHEKVLLRNVPRQRWGRLIGADALKPTHEDLLLFIKDPSSDQQKKSRCLAMQKMLLGSL